MKIRGFRVETAEAEAMLVRAPGVRLAAAVLRDDHRGGRRLVGYVVPATGATLDLVEVRAFVADRLPDPLVPSALVELESFPLTGNGKLCRHRLPEPRYGPQPNSRPPRTPGEEKLRELFAEVLGVPGLGIDDNFFDLGGDAAAVSRLAERVRTVLDRTIDERMVTEAPTVAGLAQYLDIGKAVRPAIPPSRWRSKVNVGGYRIAPCDVAATLTGAPGVRDAAVGVREDRPGDRRLVGYVVPGRDSDLDLVAVQEYLATNLPHYMVPAAVVVLDALPMTAGGILDRAALPAPDPDGGSGGRRAESPQQELVRRLFVEVLGVPQVGLTDNFFELGGHSLLAIRLTNRVRAELDIEMEPETVFEAPTVTELARRLEGAKPIRPRASGQSDRAGA